VTCDGRAAYPGYRQRHRGRALRDVPHGHFEDPGHTGREDFHTGTMAAAAGGVTSVFEQPLTYPPTTTVQLYRDKREMAGTKVVIDFRLWDALTPISLDQMEGQWG
jgi:dihydroorotase-like cyclic amidohydrolase